MPRIDTNVFSVRRAYFPRDDAEETAEDCTEPKLPPVDLCMFCASYWPIEYCNVKHPPYQNGLYRCTECGCLLSEYDN